jgi:hypothetical protein
VVVPKLTDVLQSYNIRALRNRIDGLDERIMDLETRLARIEGFPPDVPSPAPPAEG